MVCKRMGFTFVKQDMHGADVATLFFVHACRPQAV